MRTKRILAAFLLAIGLCFTPGVGYGEIEEWMVDTATFANYIDVELLNAKVYYIMTNPTNFLNTSLYYDPTGIHGSYFPEGVVTKGRIFVAVYDSRGVFRGKSRVTLLGQFKIQLEAIYSFIDYIATDMDTDIVVKFYSGGEIPLGYFYQGEYHLWEEVSGKKLKEEGKTQVEKIERTVYIAETGEKYHKSDCRYLKESSISISLTEAKQQGYTPCKVCNPPQKVF